MIVSKCHSNWAVFSIFQTKYLTWSQKAPKVVPATSIQNSAQFQKKIIFILDHFIRSSLALSRILNENGKY